jgi:adenosylcobinamide-GDP ribazoletransferase
VTQEEVQAPAARSWPAGLRLALTMLTILPISGPRQVDRRSAGWAMTFAPLVGVGLGICAGLVVFGARELFGHTGQNPLPALCGLAVLAVLTGGLHLDGVADLADGFGARRDAAGTLAVMREPAVGAFAVVALLFVVALQASALTLAIGRNHGTVSLLVAVVTGRIAVVLACTRTAPARPEGLGALVAGSVPRGRAAVVVVAGLVFAVLAGRYDFDGGRFAESGRAVLALLVGLLAAEGVRRLAVRRLGGINGDVLGALVETATLATLLVMAADLPSYLS